MSETRIKMFVEEYLFYLQEPSPPQRAALMGAWCSIMHEQCSQKEIARIMIDAAKKMGEVATTKFH